MGFWMKLFGFDKEINRLHQEFNSELKIRDVALTNLLGELDVILSENNVQAKDISSLQDGDIQDDEKDAEHDVKLRVLRQTVEELNKEINIVADWGNEQRDKLHIGIKEWAQKELKELNEELQTAILKAKEGDATCLETTQRHCDKAISDLTVVVEDVQKEFQERLSTTSMAMQTEFQKTTDGLKEDSHAMHEDVKKSTAEFEFGMVELKQYADNAFVRKDSAMMEYATKEDFRALGKQITDGDNNVIANAVVMDQEIFNRVDGERTSREAMKNQLDAVNAAHEFRIEQNTTAIEQNVGLIDDIKGQL